MGMGMCRRDGIGNAEKVWELGCAEGMGMGMQRRYGNGDVQKEWGLGICMGMEIWYGDAVLKCYGK